MSSAIDLHAVCASRVCHQPVSPSLSLTVSSHCVSQNELLSGDQNGNIRVWDLTANACSCELVPEVGTAVRSLSCAQDGSMVVAANNSGTCYVWRLQRGANATTHFEPVHKLNAHSGYILKCLISPDGRYVYIPTPPPSLRASQEECELALVETSTRVRKGYDKNCLHHDRGAK
jgi:WD40 repeat protein